jgi:hypothetical protein
MSAFTEAMVETKAKDAYDAFSGALRFSSVPDGRETWAELHPHLRDAWIAATRATLNTALTALTDSSVILPREPTEAMVIAAMEWGLVWMKQHNVTALSPFKDYPPVAETTRGMYRAMRDAALGGKE